VLRVINDSKDNNGDIESVIEYEDWLKIDKVEKERGQLTGKKREKILEKAEMLKIINK
jgi:hypothetical protein